MKKYGIHFILALALLVRLYHITFPVEGWHAWRQADAAAIARNFYDNGFDFFHPQINHGGNTPGYVDTEFPFYPYLVALLYALFGVHDGWGRAVSVLSSLGTIYILYLLTKKYLGERVALWAGFLYAVLPLSVYYSRTFMPPATVLLCAIGGIYFFSEWLDTQRKKDFILSVSLLSLAVLMNPTNLVLGLPLAYLARLKFQNGWLRTPSLWWYATIAVVPAVCWYTYSHLVLYSPHLTIGIWSFGSDKWANFDLILTPKFYNDIFFKSIAERHLTYPGMIAFIVGLFIKRKSAEEKVFDWWLIAVVIYFIVVAKGNDVHEYYQLPFVLPAVVFMGKTFSHFLTPSPDSVPQVSRIWKLFFGLCCIAIIPLSVLRYIESFASREQWNSPMTRLAERIEQSTKVNDLIITVSEGDPILLYRSHRKGWVISPAMDSVTIEWYRQHHANYLAGLKSVVEENGYQELLTNVLNRYILVENDDQYFILRLSKE